MLLTVDSALLTSTYTAEERDADGLTRKLEMGRHDKLRRSQVIVSSIGCGL